MYYITVLNIVVWLFLLSPIWSFLPDANIKDHPDLVSKSAQKKCEGIADGFTAQWKKRVRQLQVPIFALNTKGAWALRFDDILADALVLGPLRTEDYLLPEKERDLDTLNIDDMPKEVIADLMCCYYANKPDDTDWVVLPVTNFDAYFGSNSFSKKWLAKIPSTLIVRGNNHGVCRYNTNIH